MGQVQLDAATLAAVLGLAGTLLGSLLGYLGARRKDGNERLGSLEDNQRELIKLLQDELRAERAETAAAHSALTDCKRELVAMLEQTADTIRGTLDRIDERIEGEEG